MKNESIISYCINIPEGATNGDVIKAVFPNYECREYQSYVIIVTPYGNISFWKDWWNEPYKAGEEK